MPPDLTHMNIRIPNRLLCFTISILFRYSTGINLVSTLIVSSLFFLVSTAEELRSKIETVMKTYASDFLVKKCFFFICLRSYIFSC